MNVNPDYNAYDYFNQSRLTLLPRTHPPGMKLEFDMVHSSTLCRAPASLRRRADLRSGGHLRARMVILGPLTQNHNQAIDEFLRLYDQFCTRGTDQVVIFEGSLIL
jgi:hypothetical protein